MEEKVLYHRDVASWEQEPLFHHFSSTWLATSTKHTRQAQSFLLNVLAPGPIPNHVVFKFFMDGRGDNPSLLVCSNQP